MDDQINKLNLLIRLYSSGSISEDIPSRTKIEIPQYIKELVAWEVVSIISREEMDLTSFIWLTPKWIHIVKETLWMFESLLNGDII